MKTIRLLAFGLFCVAVFSASAHAQAAAPGKIVVINSFAFADEKAGLTKFVAAHKMLNTEFTPAQNELQTMATRLKTISTEIQTAEGSATPDRRLIQTKVDEGQKLGAGDQVQTG